MCRVAVCRVCVLHGVLRCGAVHDGCFLLFFSLFFVVLIFVTSQRDEMNGNGGCFATKVPKTAEKTTDSQQRRFMPPCHTRHVGGSMLSKYILCKPRATWDEVGWKKSSSHFKEC